MENTILLLKTGLCQDLVRMKLLFVSKHRGFALVTSILATDIRQHPKFQIALWSADMKELDISLLLGITLGALLDLLWETE
jgi:hypothetical protein